MFWIARAFGVVSVYPLNASCYFWFRRWFSYLDWMQPLFPGYVSFCRASSLVCLKASRARFLLVLEWQIFPDGYEISTACRLTIFKDNISSTEIQRYQQGRPIVLASLTSQGSGEQTMYKVASSRFRAGLMSIGSFSGVFFHIMLPFYRFADFRRQFPFDHLVPLF